MSEALKLLKKKNFMIGVPSRGREFLVQEKRGIWKHIDPTSLDEMSLYNVHTSVRTEELKAYRLSGHVGMMYTSFDDHNIAQKRQMLLDIAIEGYKEYLIMVDDDVSFYYRDNNLSSKYTSKHEVFVEKDHFNRILYECISLCREEYPLIGVPLKQGSFDLKYMFSKNIPAIRFTCYHVPTLIKENIRFDTMFDLNGAPFMEDRYVQLSLISKGYRTLSNCRYCVGDPGTNYKGGCSLVRNVENHNLSAEALIKTFPNYVFLKWKDDGHWGVKRKDCTIKWRKFLSKDELKYIPSEKGLMSFDHKYLSYIERLEAT